MMRALAFALVLALAGCITFDEAGTISVRVLVTRDVGTQVLRDERMTLAAGSSALDAVDEIASIERAYGGGFVSAIDGLASRFPDEHVDWFYHVDARAYSIGAAAWTLEDGETVLWDYRPWNRTLILPYVVTGWPVALNVDQLPPARPPSTLATYADDPTLYARATGDTLVILDEWGVPDQRIAPPWLLVHAHADEDGALAWLVVAAGDASALVARLSSWTPSGVGVAVTGRGLVEVPA